ncbi:unnamed protein product, partial [Effrenium voratum]
VPLLLLGLGTCIEVFSLYNYFLDDLEHQLSEARQSDASLHLQVRAVEDMLAEVNHGEGWGIPVSRGFVLSKSMLQSLCVRFLLAGTVIKTFLDSELGLKDPPPALQRPHHGANALQII